ncbi:MAG TPA: acetate uptake transporter [Candidatus Dormibacteraeota bacterium]|nr:acetate uptake transporter [Candidatus Dormibacteraeota bacterium]
MGSSSPAPKLGNPAGLGLAGFALTTFLLSAANAGLLPGSDVWMGFALFYGGLAQLFAGMWEFATGNTFGATAFGSYGAFWLGTAFYVWFWAPKSGNVGADLAWLLGAWTIFTAYMTLESFRINNPPVMWVFVVLLVTFVLLWLGAALHQAGLTQVGGYLGIVTALLAWYASYKAVHNSIA